MEENLILRRKAELALGGAVKIPDGFRIPYRISRSTAGPGAGLSSAVFSFGGLRVKKTISREEGEFELREENGKLSMTRGGLPFLENVSFEPVVYHCPEQAFFNLDQRCIFGCAFCSSPGLEKNLTKNLTEEKIVEMIRKAIDGGLTVKAVSLTNGVASDVRDTVEKMASCVKAVKKAFPDMPVGVEPYVSDENDILALYEAGAEEIKLNLETPDRDIFSKVCPGLDYDLIFENLKTCVSVFGKGKVYSNVIFGMGETDEELYGIAEKLCSAGIIPVMRALRTGEANRKNLERALGRIVPNDAKRSLRIASEQKKIMEKYGLTTVGCRTMCCECRCCDIVPFRDF